VDVLVDGEQYRGDMVAYFAETMGGFARGGLVRSYGNRYYHKPVIVGEMRWPGPITVDWWRWTQSLTGRPVKGMLTGPYTNMDWSFDEYYPDRKAACLALAGEVRRAGRLLEAGAKIVQIDEPARSARRLPFAVETIGSSTAARLLHRPRLLRRFETMPGLSTSPSTTRPGDLHSALDLLAMFEKNPFTKDLSLGVLDVHSHLVESPDGVKARIRRGASAASRAHLGGPDCGLRPAPSRRAGSWPR
jgi:5-methyltetrahydropteroyltriglutamate--homocysteine methyltransferase